MGKQYSDSRSKKPRQIRNLSALDLYMRDIEKIPLLTHKEEVELTKRIKKGGQRALEKLVLANTRFVVRVAGEYQTNKVPLNDLISYGNVGLVNAAKKYDGRRGYRFITYAVWWIRQSINTALINEGRTVRLPANKIKGLTRVANMQSHLLNKLGRNPSDEELAGSLEMIPEQVKYLWSIYKNSLSLDAPLNNEGKDEDSVLSIIPSNQLLPDEELILKNRDEEVAAALGSLPDKEAEILRLYFGFKGDGMNFNQIGRQIGLSRERVRQIKESALRKLRHPSRIRGLRDYREEEKLSYSN